ncbi:MAG TPA: LLM class flavin-dependent oxidoreductase, partial [Roseiflexaceae bacterium]|nr:LLM class flavin-dependent oxidoreductase [Roseiflexaceae bacterium]
SPKMTHMIGELADGGLPLLFPPEHYTAVAALVAAGAASTGRDATAIDLAACIWVSVDADHTAAEAALREKIAYYGSAMSDDILARLGVARDEMLAIDRMVHEARAMARAMAMVTPAMLQIGIVGTTADLIPRLEALVAAGARHLSFGPPLGPDPLAALQLIGRDIIPYFRS